MNTNVQCCSIILLIWIVYMYKRSQRLPLRSNKAFKKNLYMTLIGLLLDVTSTLGIVYSDRLPDGVTELLCKTHVASLVLVSMTTVEYVFTNVTYQRAYYKKKMLGIAVLGIIDICTIYLLPIAVHHDPINKLSWIDGPSPIAAYFGVGAFIFINLIQIYHHRKHIYDRQRVIVAIWMLMWIAAAVIQYFNDTIMVVSFATALSIVLIFIQFENPELYLDRTTGLFNSFAYRRYLEQLYSESDDFSVVGISFAETPWQDNLQLSGGVEASQKLYKAFLKIPGAYVFKIQDNEIMLVFPDTESAKYAWGVVNSERHMPNTDSLPSRPMICYIPDSRCVNSPRGLLELLRYVSMHDRSAKDDIFHTIDNAMMEQIHAERATAQMIRDALDEDRVVVYYQPIYSVAQKRFTSAEALVRIIEKNGKLVPPGAFIRVAEDQGLIIELGKRVLEKTCHFYQSNCLDRYGLEYIEVNLSILQCTDNRLSEDYIDIMEKARIEPCRINLEITESTSAQNKQMLISHMEKMISRGVNFSLDDFGSGASNLNYIVDMPVEIVKFDREMTQAYFSSHKAKYVMDAAMHMIRGMGLKIVAEGIETEEQYRKMEEIEINYIQGFYFSKPLPEQELLEFLSRENIEASD